VRRLVVALAAVGSLGCLSACAAGGHAGLRVSRSVSAPQVLPKGAQPVAASAQAATPDTSCNGPKGPVASLRPSGALPAVGYMPAGSYMAKIAARGYLIAGVDQNSYLWGYRNPQTQELEGFDIDMVKQVAIATFGDASPQHLKFVVVPNPDRQAYVANGTVDLVAETMTITCDRQNGKDRLPPVDFSAEYYAAHQEILVPRGSPITSLATLAGRRVCAQSTSTSLAHLAQQVPTAKLWEATNQPDCLVLLQQGQVDAISTDDTILEGLAAQDPNLSVLPDVHLSNEPYGMAISKSHPEFTRFVNAVLTQEEQGKDSVWQQIWTKWLSSTLHTSAPAPPTLQYRD
jgi:polar amino acid transport system substrate-binding protein